MTTTQLRGQARDRRTSPLPVAAVRAARPRQWLKNALVLAAPFAAGRILDLGVLAAALQAVVAFSLVASSVYLGNDVRDVEEDRRHPTKRFRPIADGSLPAPVALALAVVLCAAGLALGFHVDPLLAVTLGVYLLLQAAYSGGLKHQTVLDLALVASGFLLRAIAGGVATDIPLSPWFLLVASFGSLFMVAGKRYSEMRELGAAASTRRSLRNYSESYLRFVWSLAAGMTVIAYSLWALEEQRTTSTDWALGSIAPFALALLRYAADIDRGTAGAPEDIVVKDRVLQGLGVTWLALVAVTVLTR